MLARADYNDIDGRKTLEPGEYEFHFQIPANTFSNGEYRIVFDIAEAKVKDYADAEHSSLTFEIVPDPTSQANVFCENIPSKFSIIRGKWLQSIK